jgi:hypothetical protein
MGLSPLHARVMWLFDELKDHGCRCGVDNLYMSCRFAKFCYNHENKILLEVLPEREEEFHRLLCRRKSRAPSLKPQPEALSRQILWLPVSMTPSQSTSSPWSLSTSELCSKTV